MTEKPYNPGLSEKAWKNLHSLIARLSIKYSGYAIEDDQPKALPRKRAKRSSSVAN